MAKKGRNRKRSKTIPRLNRYFVSDDVSIISDKSIDLRSLRLFLEDLLDECDYEQKYEESIKAKEKAKKTLKRGRHR